MSSNQPILMHFPSYLILYDTLDCPVRDTHLISFSCSSWILLYIFFFLRLSLSVSVFFPSSFIDMGNESISGDSALSRKSYCVNKLLFSSQKHFSTTYWPLAPCVLEVFIGSLTILPYPQSAISHLICHVLSSFYSYHLCVLRQDIATVCGP